jgi:probable phosphoglycerate mutase
VTRRIVLLRHGQTTWNAADRLQGQTDTELDETGHEQARAVAPVIAALTPAAIWTSDLVRAARTAEYVGDAAGVRPTYDVRLREFHLGERQGLTHAEFAEADPDGFARFRAGDWADIEGVEHPKSVAERYGAALAELAGSLGPGETGVVVSHGAAIRTGLVAFLGWPLECARDLRALGNCARGELVQRDNGAWAIAAYNLPPDFTAAPSVG